MRAETIDRGMMASSNSDDFRIAMRKLVSSVAVVTSCLGKVRNGLTATAVCSVSIDPPTILVCIGRKATAERLMFESKVFAINFLAEGHHDIARAFSTPKLKPEDRFASGQWTSLATGAPVLQGAVAAFDCAVEQRILSGTHYIYIGRVLALASPDHEAPLLYRDGVFRKLAATS